MKKILFFLVSFLMIVILHAGAQCAMCTKTAQQLGEKPAQGLNSGIIYLMLAPFTIVGFIVWRLWKNNNAKESNF